MAIVEVSYRRVYNLGNSESMAVELKATVEALQDHEAVYVGLIDEAARLAGAYWERGRMVSARPVVAEPGWRGADAATDKQLRLIQHMREDLGKDEEWLREVARSLRLDLEHWERLSKRDASALIDQLKLKGGQVAGVLAPASSDEELPF